MRSLPEVAFIAEAVLSHHEHFDGTGYPRGLKGEEIPLISRIIAVIDAYDVMTRGRHYQEKKSTGEALEELMRCAGSQFDPRIVEEFCTIVERLFNKGVQKP